MRITTFAKTILPAGAALALAACGGAEEEEPAPAMTETELEVQDLSGGEMISVNEDAEGVEVELPETPMTNASEEEMAAAAEDGE